MAFERVQIAAGGSIYEGWLRASVRAAYNEAVRSFEVEVTEPGMGPSSPFTRFPLLPFTPVSVYASGSLLVTGYVDEYSPSYTERSHSVVVKGRGKGADYVDCSCKHPTGWFTNKTVDQIAQELDLYGIGIRALGLTGGPVPWFALRKGATPFAEVMRLLQQRGATMKGEADGSISIVKGSTGRHSGGLIQGRNILQAQALLTGDERFSEIETLGQSSLGTEDEHLKPHGKAVDGSVSRFRNKTIVDHAETDKQRIQERADTEMARSKGWSTKATIVAPTFRDEGGRVWEPGHLVFVHSPWLKIESDMMIEAVEWRQDDQSGSTSTLSLVDPQAYGGSAVSATGSDAVWRFAAGAASAVQSFKNWLGPR